MSEVDQAKEIRRLLDCEQKKLSPFVVLNLDIATCTLDDVNKAFRRIALLLHPDKCKLPRCGDAFHVAEKAHKLLGQEVVLAQLKAADTRRREKEAETKTFVPQKPAATKVEEEAAVIGFGSLTKLATSGMSTEEQKAAEIARVLAAKPTDYFLILDVDPATCEVADVDKRYRRMAQALHPDKCSLPRVNDAFAVFEKAHKELADAKKLVRFKIAFQQQQKKAADLRAEAARKAAQPQHHQPSSMGHLTAQERLEIRKKEALREHQLQSARLADEAARKRQKHEQENVEKTDLAADLERQRKEWRDLHMM